MLVVALVASVLTVVPGVGDSVAGGISTLLCRVAGGECAAPEAGEAGAEGDGGAGTDAQNEEVGGGGDAGPAPDVAGGPGAQPPGGDGQALPGEPVPLDDLQVAAFRADIKAQAPPPGHPGGPATDPVPGPQVDRLPRGGTYPYVPPKGTSLDRPGSLPRQGGSIMDAYGNGWRWDPVKGEWDVQHHVRGSRRTTHTNVGPNGEITHGPDNFPRKPRLKDAGEVAPAENQDGDTAKTVVLGGITTAGVLTALWWGAKLLSPFCGPAAPACAMVL